MTIWSLKKTLKSLILCCFVLSFSLNAFPNYDESVEANVLFALEGVRFMPFTNQEGKKINVTVFNSHAQGPNSTPIVIVPGLGETQYRYKGLADYLTKSGFGPIYLIEHINQGRSDQLLNTKNHILHANQFRGYVEDFLFFMKGPLKNDLKNRGIQKKPVMVAHSMGGAILNLALLEDKSLAERAVYISPMFQIKMTSSNRLNRWLKVGVEALCFNNCGSWLKKKIPKNSYRRGTPESYGIGAYSRTMEVLRNQEPDSVTLGWLKEALIATDEIRARAAEYGTPSLIYISERDDLVDNRVFEPYVCKNSVCKVVSLDGEHSLHLDVDPNIRQTLFNGIAQFASEAPASSASPHSCRNIFKK